jgi:hypothetical protein
MSNNDTEQRRVKNPGRVRAAQRVNELLRQRRAAGEPWPGGRVPVHAMQTLEKLLKRGDAQEGQLAVILAQHEGDYVNDLGGRENVSSMEAGICKRLAEGDLFLALIRARLITARGQPRRLTWDQTKDVAALHARLADSYTRMAQALGLKRRAKELPDLQTFLAQAAADGKVHGGDTQ